MIIERTGQKNSGGKCSGKIRFSNQSFVTNKTHYLVACDPKSKGYRDGERVALVEAANHLPFFSGECPLAYAEEFTDALYRWTLQHRGEKKMAIDICVDRVISFHPDDPLTPLQGLALAKEAVSKVMGPLEERLCLFAVHVNERHLHVHVLASTVNSRGIIFNPRNDDRLWNRAAAAFEVQRELRQVNRGSKKCDRLDAQKPSVKKAEYQRERRTGEASTKAAIRDILETAIQKANGDFYRFLDLIADDGVWPVVNQRKESGPIRGISFEYQGEYFAGSDLGKNYRWAALKKAAGYTDSASDRTLLWGLKDYYDKHDTTCELDVEPVPAVKPLAKTSQLHQLLGYPLRMAFCVKPTSEGLSFQWRSSQREAFREQRKPLKFSTTYGRNRKVVKAMLERTHAQGGKRVRVWGSERFKALVKEFAVDFGIIVIESGGPRQAPPAKAASEPPRLAAKQQTPVEHSSVESQLEQLKLAEQNIVKQLAKLRYKHAPEPLAAALKGYLTSREKKIHNAQALDTDSQSL